LLSPQKCCGLTGPWDYRSTIYGKHCESQQLDVPYTCCNLHNLLPESNPVQRKNGAFCDIGSAHIFKIDKALVSKQTGIIYTDAELQDPKIKCKVINNDTAVVDTQYEWLIRSQVKA